MTKHGFNPQYKIIADKIRDEILSGKIAPGTRLRPDTEIAKEYGVNKRTVANGMAKLVADGLISRTPGRGSVVVRQQIVNRKSDAVGVISCCNGDIYTKMEEEITEQTLKKGFYPLWVPQSLYSKAICNKAYRPFLQMLDHFINDCPYGMLIHGERFIPFDLLERNIAKIGKLVFISDYLHSKKLPAKYVLIDYKKAAEKIIAHFAEYGHRNITMLTSHMQNPVLPDSLPPQAILLRELAAAAKTAGMKFNTEIPNLLFARTDPEQIVRDHILPGKITAAVLGYDSIWQNHYRPLLKKYPLAIPENLSLIGFFNTPWAEEFHLTSVNIHEEKIAKIATEMLFEDDPEPKEIYVEPELVLRNSVAKPSSEKDL